MLAPLKETPCCICTSERKGNLKRKETPSVKAVLVCCVVLYSGIMCGDGIER